jgi:hypothetical protein
MRAHGLFFVVLAAGRSGLENPLLGITINYWASAGYSRARNDLGGFQKER